MNIGVDAAAFGMANAVTASSANVNSGYWNPAGLLALEDNQFSLMHASYFSNIASYDYGAFAMPLDDRSAVAFSIIRFGVDDILNTTQLIDDQGNKLKSAPPSTPVNVLGWSEVPDCGAICKGVKNERVARREADEHAVMEKKLLATPVEETTEKPEGENGDSDNTAAVDALFAAISKSKSTAYRVIIKGDVRGSVEALKDSLNLIESDKVLLEIIHSDVGMVTKNDVKMANTSNADILAFNVKLENGVMGEAKHLGVQLYHNSIIYQLIDLVKENMSELLEPELVENKTGRAEVRQVFRISKSRAVAGCMIMEGVITRNKGARLVRSGEVIAEGKIDTLRRFKDDVTEVKAGFECGMRLDSFDKYEEGDVIETFEIDKIRPTL